MVLAYVAIIAAKLVRLQRQTAELLELVPRPQDGQTGDEGHVGSAELTTGLVSMLRA